jgi:hypothetical protein
MLIAVIFVGLVVIVAGLALTALAICVVDGPSSGDRERGTRELSHANDPL